MKNKLLGKTFLVLEKICSSTAPVALKTMVDELDINYATASRVCSDLMEMELIGKCGYHHYSPAPGLIRLGSLAKTNSPITKNFLDCLKNYKQTHDEKVVLYNLCKNTLSLIYSDDDMSTPLCKSTLVAMGAMLLAYSEKLPVNSAVQKIIAMIPEISAHEVTNFKKDYETATQQGYLISNHDNDLWSICVPLPYMDNLFGVALCGGDCANRDLGELYLNFSRFVTKLQNNGN